MEKPTPPTNKQQARNWVAYSGMAFEMFAIIGVFTGIGFFLDKQFQTQPILILLFLFIGLAAAFYRIYQQFSNP
ncbi:MAG: AtpZ/AtpI family protein [Sphingobacteriales bacterium]|jgi:F0F1-type ATP synthase assembly protein I|nr:AtpZ/AtpI family protein [Sphingobacteriales bacterium]